MKFRKWLVPLSAVLICAGFFSALKVRADETAPAAMKSGTDYAALAAKYEKMAADQDAVIAEHQEMLRQTGVQHPGNEKHGGNPMDKHCNAIIRDAKKLKADYLAFAAWAKLAAKEDVK